MKDADVVAAPLQVIAFDETKSADKASSITTTLLHRGKKPPLSVLRSDSVLLLDTGFELFIREGASATQRQKALATTAAKTYLQRSRRPTDLPTTRFREGEEEQRFLELFSRAAAEAAATQPACVAGGGDGDDDEFCPQSLRNAFRQFDVDGDGRISSSEFLRIMQPWPGP